MAVYTVLTKQELAGWVTRHGLGELIHCRGVSDGIENSTYFLTLARPGGEEEYVLTISEKTGLRQVGHIAQAMARLAEAGLPVPRPLGDAEGGCVFRLHGKPALLVPRIRGDHPELPSPGQCRQIGTFLSRMHRSPGPLFSSDRSLGWLERTARRLLPQLDPDSARLLREELARLQRIRRRRLPVALIHGDLFRDNALFQREQLAAVIDFFMAGSGYPLFDLAVAVNDWCSLEEGSLDPDRTDAMLRAYTTDRPLQPEEEASWPDMLCLAATRFWVSRKSDQLEAQRLPDHTLVPAKDPDAMLSILMARRQLR